jgi:hypothetical protein
MREAIKHFQDYYYLLDNLHKGNVAENVEYQRKYKGYWVMGRLSPKFYQRYFDILENNKNNGISINYVVNELQNIDNKIHFSFSSKLVHMIDNEKPIYDSKINNFYRLPEWKLGLPKERVDKIIKIYDFLSREYKRVKDHRLLSISISKVRNYYKLSEMITDEKIMDSIIWMFINYAESGIGKIQYK